ncbi:MAG: efflux RND transporter periplasmic adaptor subunit [Clostridiales bacterium]|nr:efflux RND transporter periplasmic adaptor subunit [Clostridiales bacterium]
MTQRIIAVIVIVALGIGGAVYAYRGLFPPPAKEAEGPIYATADVVRGDIHVTVTVQGPLYPSQGGAIYLPWRPDAGDSPGYVFVEYKVKEGDFVKAGDTVVVLAAPALEEQLQQARQRLEQDIRRLADLLGIPPDQVGYIDPSQGVILRAPIDGRLTGFNLKQGQQVKSGQVIGQVVDDSRFIMQVAVLPAEFGGFGVGSKAFIRLENYDGWIEGTVTDISPGEVPVAERDLCGGSPESQNYFFVRWVTVEGKNPGLVMPGMKAQVGIATSPEGDGVKDTRWLRYCQTVEGYGAEEPVVSPVEGSVTKIHVQNLANVKKGDPIVVMAGADVQKQLREMQDRIDEDRQKLAALQQAVGRLEVKAPIDGIVVELQNMNPGQPVQDGTWFGSVFSPQKMQLQGNVSDVDVVKIQVGAPVTVTVDATPGVTYQGVVRDVSPSGKDESGIPQFMVWIEFEGGPQLRPGMMGRAIIDVGHAENTLLIPIEAIFQERGQPAVEVLNPDGTTTTRIIKVGLMGDREVEVLSGLEEGEKVVVGSSLDLLPSQKPGSNPILPQRPAQPAPNTPEAPAPAPEPGGS